MNVCKWCMSGTATENSISLSVLPRLNNIFNQSINQSDTSAKTYIDIIEVENVSLAFKNVTFEDIACTLCKTSHPSLECPPIEIYY